MSKEELQEIINTYKWIKVDTHVYYEDNGLEGNYEDLKEHHVKETTFLIEKCRELATELLKYEV
jgi:mRNA-degrading endonuclease YafQ of YafQ-DinJ toxin-antitoxin module